MIFLQSRPSRSLTSQVVSATEEAILDSVSLSEDAVRLSSRNSAPQSEVDELMKDSEVNELMEQYETIVREFRGSVTPDDKSKLS